MNAKQRSSLFVCKPRNVLSSNRSIESHCATAGILHYAVNHITYKGLFTHICLQPCEKRASNSPELCNLVCLIIREAIDAPPPTGGASGYFQLSHQLKLVGPTFSNAQLPGIRTMDYLGRHSQNLSRERAGGTYRVFYWCAGGPAGPQKQRKPSQATQEV